MSNAEMNNIPFKSGKELWVKGVSSQSTSSFSINAGTDEKNIALCITVDYYKKEVTMNSIKDGFPGKAMRAPVFPFQLSEDFEVTTKFVDDTFHIVVPGSQPLPFPNRLIDILCNKIWVEGNAAVHGMSIK